MLTTASLEKVKSRSGNAKISSSLRKFACLFCVCVVMLMGCGYPGDIEGPNGYAILSDKGVGCGVHKNGWEGEVVVKPEVDSYAIVNQFIIGHSQSGFFIVDTLKNNTFIGLSEEQWENRLALFGIHHPKLLASAYGERQAPSR